MTPSTIWTGHALRSAIAHGDQHRQRSCIAPATSRARGAHQVPGTKPFENHLVGVARRAFALLRRAHGPGQQRQAEDVAGDPGRRRRQLVDPDRRRNAAGCGRRGADAVMPRRCAGVSFGQ